MIGTILDRKYRIVELIGTGGMAQVYKAVNMVNRKTVAVKVLKDEYKDDAEFLRRFSRETNAILTLSHENIVRAYGAGTHNGMPYLIMEYVEGHTLKDLIAKNGAMPVRTAIGIACQILDALDAAHSHGIIHRDVKPQNVIVTDKGRVKLADFGIAREAKASTVTFSGSKVLGSVHYISPEQAKGTVATEQSDLYSVGVCLYEMLTGTIPFDSDSAVSVALMHIREKPVPPIQLVTDLPRSLNDIVLKALEKAPENRYHTAKAMRSDLVRSLSDPNGGFVNDPNDKGSRDDSRPSVYVLIAMCVFLPILLIGIFVLIYATSCRNKPVRIPDSEETAPVVTAEATAPAETDPGEDSVPASFRVPDLVGYSLDDALRILYRDHGFTNLSVVFTTESPSLYTRPNSVIAIVIPSIEQKTLFEVSTPAPTEVPGESPDLTPEVPSDFPEPTDTPAPTGDTDTVTAEVTETPPVDSITQQTEAPPSHNIESVDVTPTPEPSHEPVLTDETYPYNAQIRLIVYRSSLGSYKADINFKFSFPDEDDVMMRRVEIGFETATFEEIPYRVIQYSRLRQIEKTSDLSESATLYWYEPITRNIYLYINGIAQSSPQSVMFAK